MWFGRGARGFGSRRVLYLIYSLGEDEYGFWVEKIEL